MAKKSQDSGLFFLPRPVSWMADEVKGTVILILPEPLSILGSKHM